MVATANGLDSRLLQAAQALLAVGRGSPDGRTPLSLPQFVAQRCRQLLAAYPSSIAEDEALLQQLDSGSSAAAAAAAAVAAPAGATGGEQLRTEQLQTAVRYRLGKKRVLQATLVAIGDS
jgi:hypothetical protein